MYKRKIKLFHTKYIGRILFCQKIEDFFHMFLIVEKNFVWWPYLLCIVWYMKGIFFIILGVSWSGKSTIIQELIKDPAIVYVPSYATRDPRPGEEDGKPYRFIKPEQFMQWIEKKEFLEYALVHQKSYYGTKRSDVESIIDQHKYPLKELDMQWLISIQEQVWLEWETISVFLDVDDITMRQRILGRNPWTSEEEVARRIASAQYEREQAKIRCNYHVDATQPVQDVIASVKNIVQKHII